MYLIPLAIPIAFAAYYIWRHGRVVSTFMLLAGVYAVMGVCAGILEVIGYGSHVFSIRFDAMAYLSVCLAVVFFGFVGCDESTVKVIRIRSNSFYKVFEVLLIVGGFASGAFFLPFAIRGLSGDIEANRIGLSEQQLRLAQWGIVNSVMSLCACMFMFSLICGLLRLGCGNVHRNRLMCYLLVSSSLSYVIYVLAYVGRDGVVYWIMSCGFCMVLVRGFIPQRVYLRAILVYIGVAFVLGVPFWLITQARFGRTFEDVAIALVSYGGQQVGCFNDRFVLSDVVRYGRDGFPEIVGVFESVGLFEDSSWTTDRFLEHLTESGVKPWMFSTFLGSLMADFGKFGAFLCSVGLCVCVRAITRKMRVTGIWEFSSILAYVLLFQYVYWGVLYNRLYAMNYYMLAVAFLALAFRVVRVGDRKDLWRVRCV